MFDSAIYDINKTIPRKSDLKKLCSKHSTTEAAIEVIAGQVRFERMVDEFHKNKDFRTAIDAVGDYAAKWNGWKTTAGKKHPKFIASFEKEILPKVAKVAKELTTQKKEKEADDENQQKLAQAHQQELTKPAKILFGTCQEIMVDAVTISSTVFGGGDLKAPAQKVSALATSIIKRITGAKSQLQALIEATRGNKKAAGLVKEMLLGFKDIAQRAATLIQTGRDIAHTNNEPSQYSELRMDVYVVGQKLHGTAKKLRDECARAVD